MLPLCFDRVALERCFLVADLLAEDFANPVLEYGLVGVSAASRPLHVLWTPLLPGQRVSAASVDQPGWAVLRLRKEIQALSLNAGCSVLPAVFIHRHPKSSCVPSTTDQTFLRGVWVDQVATVLTLPGLPSNASAHCPSGCAEAQANGPDGEVVREEPGVAFSLIVSRERLFELHAVAKHRCPVCGDSWVCDVPTKLTIDPPGRLSPGERAGLRESLKLEIEEKLDPRDLEVPYYEYTA